MPQCSQNDRYFLAPLPDQIQLVIMGKDPYPSTPTNVPFCKPDWNQQTKHNCSGRYVLASLGVDFDAVKVRFKCPGQLFDALRDDGIIFLNASYRFVGTEFRKKRDLDHLKEAFRMNERFLVHAKHVLLCGEAKKSRWASSLPHSTRSDEVVHPDVRNRANRKTNDEWERWWNSGAIANRYKPAVTV